MLMGATGPNPAQHGEGFPSHLQSALARGQLVLAFPSQLPTWRAFPRRMLISCRNVLGLGLDGGMSRRQCEVAALIRFIWY